MTTSQDREYFEIHESRYKYILKQINKVTKQQSNKMLRVLDVGCFPYHLGKTLEDMGHEVWGIASAHEPIKNKNIAILNIETDPFPYKKNFFDLVLFSEVIEHLPHSPIPPLKEMLRVTKPGGHLFITTPNIHGSIHLLFRLFHHEPSGKNATNIYHHHNHEYTLTELKTLVARAGWHIHTATRFIAYPPFRARNRTDNPILWLGKFLNFILMKLIPPLADTILVIGRK